MTDPSLIGLIQATILQTNLLGVSATRFTIMEKMKRERDTRTITIVE